MMTHKTPSEKMQDIIRSSVTLMSLYSGMGIWMIGAAELEAFAEVLGSSNLILLSQLLLLVSIASSCLVATYLRRRLGILSTFTFSYVRLGTDDDEHLVLSVNDQEPGRQNDLPLETSPAAASVPSDGSADKPTCVR